MLHRSSSRIYLIWLHLPRLAVKLEEEDQRQQEEISRLLRGVVVVLVVLVYDDRVSRLLVGGNKGLGGRRRLMREGLGLVEGDWELGWGRRDIGMFVL